MHSYELDKSPLSIALQVHMGIGAVMMGGFSYIFADSYHSTKKQQSKIFKALPLASTFFKLFYYILNLIIYTTQDTSLIHTCPIFLRFFSWGISVPPILIAIVLLESSAVTDIICLCTLNSIMYTFGYYAHIATHPASVWSFYGVCLCCAYFMGRNMFNKYTNIRLKKKQSINNKIYQFLCVYTLIIWGLFPISFIFYKTNIISYEVQSIIYVYLDIFAKGLLGVILMGARDMLDKKEGRMVRFTTAIIHVYTREKSITDDELVTGESDETLTPPPSLDDLTPAEKDFITGESDETFTPPPSLDDLTPAEKDFITGQTPKNHTIVTVAPKPQNTPSKSRVVPIDDAPVIKKLTRTNSSPAHLTHYT